MREEHDIYLSKELADQLFVLYGDSSLHRYLLQFPLRPRGREYPSPSSVIPALFILEIGSFQARK